MPCPLPGRLSLASRPNADELDADVAQLSSAKVTTVITALPVDEEDGFGLGREAAALGAAGIELLRIEIDDFGVPDPADVLPTLNAVIDWLGDPETHVAIHCAAGLGRSPMLAAGILVLAGATLEDAWATVAAARGRPVPETSAQRGWPARLRG